MFKQFLSGVDGMNSYLIFSLVVFAVFFVAVAIYLLMMRQETIRELKQLPLADDISTNKGSDE